MDRRDKDDRHRSAANRGRIDIRQTDLPVREQAEGALVDRGGAEEIMGMSMRRTDRQQGGPKQQERQQSSQG